MKIPRDIDASQLIRSLRVLGYLRLDPPRHIMRFESNRP